MDLLFATIGSFAALASATVAIASYIMRLRRNEISHLYRRLDRLEREICELKEGMADLRERVAKLEVMRYDSTANY